MKQSRFGAKAFVLLFATILLTGVFAISAFAAERQYSYNNEYGQIIPTDSKLSAPKSSYSFSGDSATLYFMRISEGKKNAHYAIEIFSDKACTNPIRSLSGEFDSTAGNKALKITWSFKSTPSGTYYGKSYAYIEREDGIVIDSDSVRSFKIKIDRVGKKEVKLNSISNTTNGIKITWTPLTTGTKYNVYRKQPGDKKWTKLDVLGKGKSSFTDKTVKSGKTYYYTVKCFDGSFESLYNKKGISITHLATPKLSAVNGSGSAGYAKISWNKVSGASGYYVYRKGGSLSNSTWEKIATIKSGKTVSYVDKTAKSTDWHYTYTVKAYNGNITSDFNRAGVDYSFIKPPVLKTVSSYTGGVKITWADPNPETSYYYVYKKTTDGWKRLGKTDGLSFVDKDVKSGKTYTYTVKAMAKTNPGGYNSNGIAGKYLAAPTLKSVAFDNSQKAKISWSKVAGADGYRIYRKTTGEKSWTKIADIKGGSTVSFIDAVKKTSGTTYTYTVKAKSGKIFSYYNTKGISNMFLSTPKFTLTNKTTTDSPVGINISWKAIKGATGYHVYRSLPGEDFKRLASNVKGTSFYDTTAVSGTEYQYTVKALNGSYASKWNTVKTTALERPILSDTVLTTDGIRLLWNEIPGADTYYILRKTPDASKWETIGSYSTNTFIDTSDEAKADAFVYSVVAEAKGTKSDYDKTGIKSFAQIKDISAKFTPANEGSNANISLTWAFDGDYDYIEIYKSTAGEERVLLKTILSTDEQITQIIDEDIAIGTKYDYTIKTVKEGKVPTEKTASAKYPHPPIEEVAFTADGIFDEDGSYISISFAPVAFAESYEIFKCSSKDGEWMKIATVNAADIEGEAVEYKDFDIEEEKVYYYTIKGIASDRDSLYNEDGAAAIALRPVAAVAGIIVKETTILDGDTEKTVAEITWDIIDNNSIQCYKILRKTADSDWVVVNFSDVLDPTANRCIDDTIEQGVEYTYTVVALTKDGRPVNVNEIGADFCWQLPAPEEPTPEETTPEESTPEEQPA